MSSPKPLIHFVCLGNVYRSRIAEMYAKQIFGDDVRISSSGVYAAKYPKNLIGPWAQKIMDMNGLQQAASPHRTQTTQQLLDDADLVVFMHPDVVKKAKKHFDVNMNKVLVWNVRDRGDWKDFMSSSPDHVKLNRRYFEKLTWRNIKHQMHVLFALVHEAGWADVFDMFNQPLGYRLPVAMANTNSELWHRGCHAIITTQDKKVLVQKRSSKIFSNAGRLDITLGGHVDAGEKPLEALLREIKEEIGLTVDSKQCELIEVYPWRSFHPVSRRYTQSFVSTYHVAINNDLKQIKLDPKEVSFIKAISYAQARKLVKDGKLRGLGRLGYAKRYYTWLIDKVGI